MGVPRVLVVAGPEEDMVAAWVSAGRLQVGGSWADTLGATVHEQEGMARAVGADGDGAFHRIQPRRGIQPPSHSQARIRRKSTAPRQQWEQMRSSGQQSPSWALGR